MVSKQLLSRIQHVLLFACLLFVVSIVLWILLDSYLIERSITQSRLPHIVTSYSGTIHGNVYSVTSENGVEIVQLATAHGVDMAFYEVQTVYDAPLSVGTPVTFAYTSHGSLVEQVTRVYVS